MFILNAYFERKLIKLFESTMQIRKDEEYSLEFPQNSRDKDRAVNKKINKT